MNNAPFYLISHYKPQVSALIHSTQTLGNQSPIGWNAWTKISNKEEEKYQKTDR